MSYSNQAEDINLDLQRIFGLLESYATSESEIIKKDLINSILRFGQVAKFRCRSNAAYDNFSKEVFKNLAELKRHQPEGLDFEILEVV